jgi:hypothetical protein
MFVGETLPLRANKTARTSTEGIARAAGLPLSWERPSREPLPQYQVYAQLK